MELSDSEILQKAVADGIIDINTLGKQIEMNERKKYLDMHKYNIWQGEKDQKWYTYLPDEEKGRRLIKKAHQKDIEDAVIDYWRQESENPTLDDVFTEWNDRRLKLNKISDATYLRNKQVYKRHFNEFGKRKIKYITPEDITDFLEEQIPEHDLKAKAFSNLKSITRGMLKRARKRKLISFNVSDIFDDLDVSDKDFKPVINIKEKEVFDETEMPEVVEYTIGQDKTLLNLGILLLFVTGVRVGELSVFKWDDWDGCAFHINRTETRYQNESGRYVYGIKEYPKTPAGVRAAVVPPHCIWIVKEIRKLNPFGKFVFEQNGTWIKTYSFRRKLYRICNKLEITKKSPHKVRKTYASILMDNQIPDKNIIELMGHTDISCTKEFYGRDRKTSQKKAELLDAIPEFRIGIM